MSSAASLVILAAQLAALSEDVVMVQQPQHDLEDGFLRTFAQLTELNVQTELNAVPWDGAHSLELNTRVTAIYNLNAAVWSRIMDPHATAWHTDAHPTWFAVAPYASREVGNGMLLFESFQKGWLWTGLRYAARSLNRKTVVDEACGTGSVCWTAVGHIMMELFSSCLFCSPLRILATGRNLLEHGNRLICEHIATASIAYMRWREQAVGPLSTVDPLRILKEFQLPGTQFEAAGVPPSHTATDATAAMQVYASASFDLSRANDDLRAVLIPHRCVDILVAGFACWETAANLFRREGASSWHKRWVELGNNMVAYCEQAEAVAPAFRPQGEMPNTRKSRPDAANIESLPGEIPRDAFMAMLTPFVQVPFRKGLVWTMDAHGKSSSLMYFKTLNWGRFGDRYMPILDCFYLLYEADSSAFLPLPEPDPRFEP